MTQKLRKRSKPPAADHGRPPAAPAAREPERPEEIERRIVVPLVDELPQGRVVYDRSIVTLGLLGVLAGALVLGFAAWLVASGTWPLRDLGQFAASGPAVGAFTGAGIGAALGGLAGALTAVYRLPAHRIP